MVAHGSEPMAASMESRARFEPSGRTSARIEVAPRAVIGRNFPMQSYPATTNS